jgi:hypothetical protein
MALSMEFAHEFAKDLGDFLTQELGILFGPDTDRKCEEYLAEPREQALRRTELQESLKRLEGGRHTLEEWIEKGV